MNSREWETVEAPIAMQSWGPNRNEHPGVPMNNLMTCIIDHLQSYI